MTTVDSLLTDALRDRYVIELALDHGGMATVYLAHDLKQDRPIALKVRHSELAALVPERFLREIRMTARLQHPHILPVFESGEAAGMLLYTSRASATFRAIRIADLPLRRPSADTHRRST